MEEAPVLQQIREVSGCSKAGCIAAAALLAGQGAHRCLGGIRDGEERGSQVVLTAHAREGFCSSELFSLQRTWTHALKTTQTFQLEAALQKCNNVPAFSCRRAVMCRWCTMSRSKGWRSWRRGGSSWRRRSRKQLIRHASMSQHIPVEER
jgi:hypothetical protein